MPSARPTFDCRSRRRAWQETHLDTAAAAERVGCAARALEVLSVHLSRQPTLPRKESIDGLQRLLGRLAYTSAQLACARNSGDDALREACCRLRGPLPPPPALGVPAAHERAAALVGLLTRHIERVRNERTVQAKAVLVTEWWHMLLRGTQRPGAGTGRHSCHADSAGAAKDARDGDALADGRCGGQDDHAGGGTADADLTEEVLRPLSAADPPCAMPPLLRLVWHAGTRARVSPAPPPTHTRAQVLADLLPTAAWMVINCTPTTLLTDLQLILEMLPPAQVLARAGLPLSPSLSPGPPLAHLSLANLCLPADPPPVTMLPLRAAAVTHRAAATHGGMHGAQLARGRCPRERHAEGQ